MESINPTGYTVVLQNRNFRAIWLAQVLSNTALNGSFFLQLILIEQVTGSSAHLGAVIIAFSLPGGPAERDCRDDRRPHFQENDSRVVECVARDYGRRTRGYGGSLAVE